MNASDAATVLTAAALVDKRTVGEADARMWAEILPGSLGPRIAVEAVKAYYREKREMIMPADVVAYSATACRNVRRGKAFDLDKYRGLQCREDRLIWYREYHEARAAGVSHEEADRIADRYLAGSTDVDRLAIEPAPPPPPREDW